MGLPSYITDMGAPELIALIIGTCTGWGLCVRIRVDPMRKDLDEAKTELREFLTVAKQKLLGGQ